MPILYKAALDDLLLKISVVLGLQYEQIDEAINEEAAEYVAALLGLFCMSNSFKPSKKTLPRTSSPAL